MSYKLFQKEIELFEKWYGISIDIDRVCGELEYIPHIDKYIIYLLPTGSMKKDKILKLISSEYFLKLDDIDAPIFVFKCPPEYQEEYEEYLKEKEKN